MRREVAGEYDRRNYKSITLLYQSLLCRTVVQL